MGAEDFTIGLEKVTPLRALALLARRAWISNSSHLFADDGRTTHTLEGKLADRAGHLGSNSM